jgi:hypothetical protein
MGSIVEFASSLLEGGNSYIQNLFGQLFDQMDDVNAFSAFQDAYTNVLGNLKSYHEVKSNYMEKSKSHSNIMLAKVREAVKEKKRFKDLIGGNRDSRTTKNVRKSTLLAAKNLDAKGVFANEIHDHDYEYLKSFHGSLSMLVNCQRFLQLLCEGHNVHLQNYLRCQSDNSVSVDVLQLGTDVVVDFCKSEADIDVMDKSELDCLAAALELLIEMIQGPCTANQEQLATSGIVETLMKVLNGKFRFLSNERD